MRRCEWCKCSLGGMRRDALYCSAAHRLAASKARRGISVRGVPMRSSGPSGLQVSYRKAVEVLYQHIAEADAVARVIAEDAMAEALSPTQRARLEARS